MRFDTYILNENMVDKAKRILSRLDFKKSRKFLQDEFDKFVATASASGIEDEVVSMINKAFGTRYRNLDQMKRERLRESELNEDIAHFWELFKGEAFPTLSFYPALTVWLELDKLFTGQDIDITKTIVYALFWLLLVSGKYAKGWATWKKQNPEQYNAERLLGKGGFI
jgi:hypothetical protein